MNPVAASLLSCQVLSFCSRPSPIPFTDDAITDIVCDLLKYSNMCFGSVFSETWHELYIG